MKVLVCGGAGYIGSNMTAVLADHGHESVVYDNLSKGHKAAVQDAVFVQGDLADHDLLVKTFKTHNIEAVMHFAALIEVGESVHDPLHYYHNNVSNTRTLLSAMQATGIGKFVFSSSAAVYGMPEYVPITEDCPKQPINPYGQTKWAVERMCHWQAQAGKLHYAALRYFNACGAGHQSSLGEDHRPESHLIPLTIQAALGKRPDIKVFGTDYDTPDGTCIRDYIHVEDLCNVHLLALEHLENKTELIYNLGNGAGYSVRQVIDTVRQVSNRDFTVTETERRAGDPAILTADATRAKTELGWSPKYPDLETMVATAWEFHRNHPDGYPDH